jgi:hypothetical protein
MIALIPIFSSFTKIPQQWTFQASFKTTPIHRVSIDPYFNFYVSDDKGNVFKYDSMGNQLLRYSPPKKAKVSLLEAWRGINIFIFYRELQEYTILDRFLTTSNQNFAFQKDREDNEKRVGFARIATVASDNNLWVFDDEDFSIKKYDTRNNNVILHVPLDLILDPSYYDLTYIREYQNLLFINDKNKGILVFDNLGNYKTMIPQIGIDYYNFLGNNLYYLCEGKLIILDIYTSKKREVILPTDKKYKYILLSENKGYLFTEDSIDIYNYTK